MDPILFHILPVVAFVCGACIGSFINVCVYRIPLGRSVVFPGSHCAACGAPIAGYHNLPIISWLWLRGRAACCGTRIDFRYCLVELGMALLFFALWEFHPPLHAIVYAVMSSGLVIACLIDFDHFLIPDRFSLGGCAAGFLACALVPSLVGETTPIAGFSWSVIGAVAGGLTMLAVAWAGRIIFKKEAMGMGDVKFLAAMGAFLGPLALTWIVPISALIGSIAGLGVIFIRRVGWSARIPYGPFLGLAAILWLFGGEALTRAYWHHVAPLWEMAAGQNPGG